MKKTILFTVLLCITGAVRAQLLFHENFENPDSVVSIGNPGWMLYNQVQTSGLFCDSGSVALQGDSSLLTSISFSTLGAYHVILNFNHIFNQSIAGGWLEISTDGGVSWLPLTANEYRGSALNFPQSGAFSNADYGWGSPGQSLCIPITNNSWENETFDISAMCANQANVLLRYKMKSVNMSFYYQCGGWFIDDVTISGFPYSISSTSACGNDGTATMVPYFGTGPYTYSWNSNPVQTTQTATGLTNGMYTCTVSDGIVSYTDSVEVKGAMNLFSSVVHPTCGYNDGMITAYVSGGTAPYNFMWSNGAVTGQISNLSPGTYTVTVTDGNGCYVSETYVLACGFNSSNLTLTMTPAECDSATGTATVVSFVPGVPPFTYKWTTIPVQTTQTATGLEGRQFYSVLVKDANGDSALSYIFIPYSDTIIASATLTPTQCNGSTGTATGSGMGGVAPYTFLWSTIPAQTTQTAVSLANAIYTLTVTDDNGCTDETTFSIPNDIGMTAYTNVTAATCAQSNGSASIVVTGGVPPLTYSWNTNPVQTTATASNLPSGGYIVTVTDSNGCSLAKSVFVNSNSSLNINVSYSGNQCSCGIGFATVTGGTPPYSYHWSDGDTTQTDSCLAYGWHHVMVTDSNGCRAYHNLFVNYPPSCFVDVRGFVFADLNKNCVKDAGEYGIANVVMSLASSSRSYSTMTNNTGAYSFHALADVYGITQNVPLLWGQLCPVLNPDTINVPAGTIVNYDIADTAASYFDDATLAYCNAGPNTRGFNNIQYAQIKNTGTTLLNGTTHIKLDNNMTFQYATPGNASFNVSTNTVTWAYTNLIPGESRNFSAVAVIPASVPLGTLLLDSSYVTPLVTDTNPSDNHCYNNETVVGSYDPNNKLAFPEGNVQKDSLWHFYTINFQNTGNSYAVRVVVEDTLDTNLDFASMTDMVSSHSFVLDTSNYPLVRFIFNNIFLPDSFTNEPGSHGFITFRIKHFAGLPAGTQIQNTAYIYFDFNSAVVTNTVINTLVNPVSVENISSDIPVSVFPNPAGKTLFVELFAASAKTVNITVSDLSGKTVLNVPAVLRQGNNKVRFNTGNIAAGMYVISVDHSGKAKVIIKN